MSLETAEGGGQHRWRLGRHTSHSSVSQAPRAEETSKGIAIVPGGKRRKVERRQTSYFPKEIFFNILLLIPAKVLHTVMRCVCKQWYDIVSDTLFIRLHSQMASPGYLYQNRKDKLRGYCFNQDPCNSEGMEIQLPFPATILGSCDGLLLLHDTIKTTHLHVMNPVTKVKITLPPVPGLDVEIEDVGVRAGFTLDSSGHYKVVQVSCQGCPRRMILGVFTVGIDMAWRSIDVQGIDMIRSMLLECVSPYTIGGFMYWVGENLIGFTLDVDTETIYPFSAPTDLVLDRKMIYRMCLGTSFGFVRAEKGIPTVWKLADVKSGEWTKVGGLDVIARLAKDFGPPKNKCFIPLRCVDGDIWFFSGVLGAYVVVRYNLGSESFVCYPIKSIPDYQILPPNVFTLLSPKNC